MRDAITGIVLTYIVFGVSFLAYSTPIWPGMLIACLIAATQNITTGVVMSIPVVASRSVSLTADPLYLWVNYGSIYIVVGFLLLALLDKKILGPFCILIGIFYLLEYLGQPRFILDLGTEVSFIAALCLSIYKGFGGGLLSSVVGPTHTATGFSNVTSRSWGDLPDPYGRTSLPKVYNGRNKTGSPQERVKSRKSHD